MGNEIKMGTSSLSQLKEARTHETALLRQRSYHALEGLKRQLRECFWNNLHQVVLREAKQKGFLTATKMFWLVTFNPTF